MRPAPIDDDRIPPGSRRIVIGPPGNDLTSRIAPVEAAVHRSTSYGVDVYSVRCVLEDGDLEKLARGGAVWISFMERVVPFDVQVDA